MSRVLKSCGLIEIRESPIEGFGVFANGDIAGGTLLEEVPFILFPRYVNFARNLYDFMKNGGWINDKELFMENLRENFKFKEPERYYFKWHPPTQIDADSMFTVLPLGCGPCYNSSNTSNNADWKMLRDTFTFTATRDIKKDEEIKTFYGYFLGNDGTIFNCETVFHMAIDMFPDETGVNVPRIKMLRFGNLNTFNFQRQNPAAHKIHTFISQSMNGITIKRLVLVQPDGSSVGAYEVPTNIALTPLYQKLAEFKNHPASLVAFTCEWTDKETKQIKTEEIIWKK